MGAKDWVDVEDVEVRASSPDAILIEVLVNKTAKKIWIPRSQISNESEVFDEGDEGTLVIPRWLAEREALA